MQVTSTTTFQLQLTEKDYTLVTRALGYMAGNVGVVLKEGDAEEAHELSRRMLEQQKAFHLDRLNTVYKKLERSEDR